MNMAITYALIGGSIIGLAAVLLYAGLGRIAGISGIFANLLRAPRSNYWAVLFVLGLGLGGWLSHAFGLWDPAHSTQAMVLQPRVNLWLLLGGGLLVGYGTRLGSGCTSGHGVCGMARLSRRSAAATATFVALGMLTATMVHGS
ncbi:MAG: YeeE/YedE family protein [Pseudomonadales bacterium]